ncbi:MAG: hypothetical protein JKY31_04055 [Rhodobacteraceae bacterium]|nr:hypothetical protein [Paracoccaceae bacterium]
MTKKISAWAMFVRAFVVTLFAGSSVADAQNSALSDDAAWAYAVSIGTQAAVRDYLRNFPTGEHLDAAVRLLLTIGELNGTDPSPANLPRLETSTGGQVLY